MINREATIRWKGYDPDDLKPKSSKRVWANCDRCGEGRWVSKGESDRLCNSCANRLSQKPPKPKFVLEENRFIIGTGIDRIETIKEKGYDPADLKPKSFRKVWSICRGCGDGRWISLCGYRDFCLKCKDYVQYGLFGRYVNEEDRFIIGTGIDRIKTIEEKGYDPINLSYSSSRKVWSVCQDCNEGRWLEYSDYTDLCRDCFCGLQKPEFVSGEDRFIIETSVDRIETIRVMGYDPINLGFGSQRKVWSFCRACGEGRWVQYREYDRLCYSCAAKEKVDSPEKRRQISKTLKNSDSTKANADKMRGGHDIVKHHYIYDHADLSKNTVEMTRSDHSRLHQLFIRIGYIVPHINAS